MMNADLEATVRYRRGLNPETVIAEMAGEGFQADVAREAVVRVQARITRGDRRRGLTNLTLGLLVLVCGIGATFAAFQGVVGVLAFALITTVSGASLVYVGWAQMARAGRDSALARLGIGEV
jgi:hypothetical protein